MASNKEKPTNVEQNATDLSARQMSGTRSRRKGAQTARQIYDSVESASGKLGCEPTALRARLRRAQRREGNAIVADLGGGIRGFKLGRNWKLLFPAV
jgi:hypothetical protein